MPKLYLVAAPIGDVLSDLAIDGLRLLKSVSTVVLEADDGFAQRLRARGVLGPHQEVLTLETPAETIARALAVLDAGQDVLLTASSGIPCFIDPGARLVDAVLTDRLDRVELVPVGLSSALDAGLMLAGRNLEAFTFAGHFPEHHVLDATRVGGELPLVLYVRGPAVLDFVDRVRALSPTPPWRILLLKDVRKRGLGQVHVLGADDRPALSTAPEEDWVAVVIPVDGHRAAFQHGR